MESKDYKIIEKFIMIEMGDLFVKKDELTSIILDNVNILNKMDCEIEILNTIDDPKYKIMFSLDKMINDKLNNLGKILKIIQKYKK